MRRQGLPALGVFAALTVITGLLYPLAVLAAGQGLFGARADGSLTEQDGRVVGSRLLGQRFTEARYFHPRPSAAGDGYDGAASGASNLGPSNAALVRSVRERAAAYREENGLAADAPVPVDAVTSSGSGLDPDISPANARIQAARVAQARGLPLAGVRRLVEARVRGRDLGFLGDPRVNVLALNLELDRLDP